MPKTITETLETLRDVGLTPDRTAELVGVLRRQIYRWESGERTPGHDHRKRLEALGYIVDCLREIYDDDAVMAWLLRPNPALRGYTSPYLMLEAGQFKAIARLADKTVDGVQDGVSA